MLAVLDAPSNLGLRPPAPDREPGARRLADALRACGIVGRLGASDAGRVEPPPYVDLARNVAATGRGAPELADIDGLAPYVRDADVLALAEREGDPAERAAIGATASRV